MLRLSGVQCIKESLRNCTMGQNQGGELKGRGDAACNMGQMDL